MVNSWPKSKGEGSQWDEVMAAVIESDHLLIGELLDIVVDATRTVHGVTWRAEHNQKIVALVLKLVDEREMYRRGQVLKAKGRKA